MFIGGKQELMKTYMPNGWEKKKIFKKRVFRRQLCWTNIRSAFGVVDKNNLRLVPGLWVLALISQVLSHDGKKCGFQTVLCFNSLYCSSSAVKHVSCESFLVSKYNQIEQLTIISVKSINLGTRCIQHNLQPKLPGAYWFSSLLCLLALFFLSDALYIAISTIG